MAAVKISIFSDVWHVRKNLSKWASLRPLQSILQDFAVLGFSTAPIGCRSLLECQSHFFVDVSHDKIRSHITPHNNAINDYMLHLPLTPCKRCKPCQIGHITHVVYYSYFDTAVNQFLIERGVLDIHQGEVLGFVVDSGCAYFSSISFPDTIHAGIRVAKLGDSSVRYEIALYRNGDPLPCAAGHFVHVYVERSSNRAAPSPADVRDVLATLGDAVLKN